MNAISNTSPLSYLLLVDEVDVLPRLYDQIYVPSAIITELTASGAPDIVRKWAKSPPVWLLTRDPAHVQPALPLHIGELHAISLAAELKPSRLIMDDHAGRDAARSLGVPLVGTVGVLDLAAERGLLDLPRVVERLTRTNFRISRTLIEEILERDSARRGGTP